MQVDLVAVIVVDGNCWVKYASSLEVAFKELHANGAKYDQREGKKQHNVEDRGQRVEQSQYEGAHSLNRIERAQWAQDTNNSDCSDLWRASRQANPAKNHDQEVKLQNKNRLATDR